MRTEQKEIKSYQTVYIAEDGTEFDSASECQTYDNTAKGVLRGRIKGFITKKISEYDLFGAGSDEYEYIIVHPACDADVDDLLRLMNLFGASEDNKNKAQKELEPSNDYLFGIGYAYDDYDNFYYYGSCEDILNNIRKNMGIDEDED